MALGVGPVKTGERKNEIPKSADMGRRETASADGTKRRDAAMEIVRAVGRLHRMAKENNLSMIAYLLEMVALQAQDDLAKPDNK